METKNTQTNKKKINFLPLFIAGCGIVLTTIASATLGVAVNNGNKPVVVQPSKPEEETKPTVNVPIEVLEKNLSDIDFYILPNGVYKNKVLYIPFSGLEMLYGEGAEKFLNNKWIPEYIDGDTEIAVNSIKIVQRVKKPKEEHLYVIFKARKRNETTFKEYLTKIVVG